MRVVQQPQRLCLQAMNDVLLVVRGAELGRRTCDQQVASKRVRLPALRCRVSTWIGDRLWTISNDHTPP